MVELHPLLLRQIKRVGLNLEDTDEKLLKLLTHISNAYQDSETGYYNAVRSLDISSQEMAELRERLQKEKEILQSLMSEGLCILNASWEIVNLNPTAEKFLHCTINDVKGKDYSKTFRLSTHNNNQKEYIDLHSLENQFVNGLVYHCDKADLETFQGIIEPYAFSINPLPLAKPNQFNGVLILFRSIKKQIESEMALKSAIKTAQKSNQAKSFFLANMSHEIRTPMNGIMGMLQLLMHTPLNEKQQHFVSKSFEAASSLLKILGDILDFVKIETGKVSFETLEFNLKDTIDGLLTIFKAQADEKNLKITFIFDERIPLQLKGDPLRIKQIFSNVINNAIKFTPKGGNISIEVKLIELTTSNLILECIIEDTGIGIPSQLHSKVFDMFSQADESVTRRFGGTGLGLAITRQLVELMGGHIQVFSEEGFGATFTFTLKLGVATSMNIRNKETKKNLPQFNIDVLIVEDNELNQTVTSDILTMLGCRIEVVESGDLAVNAVKKRKYDLILMDCQMPTMDGFKATEKIRELERNGQINYDKNNIIIALTANALSGTRQRCLESGMDDYLTKPVNLDELTSVMSKYVPPQ